MGHRGVRIGVAAVGLVAGLAGATPPADAAPAGVASVRTCDVPTVEHDRSITDARPASASVLGASIALPVPAAPVATGADLDGDGTDDLLSSPSDTSQAVTRSGGGTVTLTDLPPGVRFTTAQAADLDGDGRDELWDTFRTPGQQGYQATAVLPGTTAAGSHPTGLAVLVFRGTVVGDVTGDGLPDAQVLTPWLPTTPDLGTTHQQGFVGALVAGDGPHDLPAGVARLSARADLDFDGEPDRVYEWLGPADGGPGGSAVALSTVPEPLPLLAADGTARTYAPIGITRVGTRTRLVAGPAFPGATRELFAVRNSCARSWLGRASLWVLGDLPADDALLGTLDPTGDLTAAARRTLATTLVRSTAGRTALVDQRFQQALHRDADPAGVTYWVAALRAGRRTPEQLSASLFGSGEFFTAHGSTLEGWVTGLYQQGVGHPADPGGAEYWKGQAQRYGRERAATRFFATPGARRATVAAWYPVVWAMGRPADPSGLERGVRLLASGGWDAFQIELLASDELYLRAQQSNRLRPA